MNFSGVDIPGLDIPGVEDEADDAFDDGATGEIPGVPNPSDNDSDSDSDSDDDEHYPIRTRSGRTVHSTQNPDYVYTTIGSDTSFLQQIREFEIDHSRERVKPLTDHEYQKFVWQWNFCSTMRNITIFYMTL